MAEITTLARRVLVNAMRLAEGDQPAALGLENIPAEGERLFMSEIVVPDGVLFERLRASVAVGDVLLVLEEVDWDNLSAGVRLTDFEKLSAADQAAA